MAFARAEHHLVLAQLDRAGIAVLRDVANGHQPGGDQGSTGIQDRGLPIVQGGKTSSTVHRIYPPRWEGKRAHKAPFPLFPMGAAVACCVPSAGNTPGCLRRDQPAGGRNDGCLRGRDRLILLRLLGLAVTLFLTFGH